MRSEKALSVLFWLFSTAAVGLVGWKFFGAEEQPMESKIVFVFAVFAVCAAAYRLFLRKAGVGRLRRWTEEAVEWSDTGVSAVVLAFLIMSFVVQAFKIPSGSMTPTLLVGDHLFVNKFIYGTQVPFTLKRLWTLKEVRRNDVVVFLCPPAALSSEERAEGVKKDFIKRAVGLPGDTVEVRNKTLYVNGLKAEDPHAHFGQSLVFPGTHFSLSKEAYQKEWSEGEFAGRPVEFLRDNFGPVAVPPGHYFVMGDNRDGSFDSRFWGPLPERFVKGKAWLVYFPFRRWKLIR